MWTTAFYGLGPWLSKEKGAEQRGFVSCQPTDCPVSSPPASQCFHAVTRCALTLCATVDPSSLELLLSWYFATAKGKVTNTLR